jgi:hypothetical protein
MFVKRVTGWIKDLNIRPETLKLLQEKVGNTLEHTGISNNFLNRILMVQQLRERIDKWDYMKLKSCTTKEMVTRLKRQPMAWEKIFASNTSDKGLITRICMELKKLNSQRNNDPMKKWAREQNFFKGRSPNGQKI